MSNELKLFKWTMHLCELKELKNQIKDLEEIVKDLDAKSEKQAELEIPFDPELDGLSTQYNLKNMELIELKIKYNELEHEALVLERELLAED